MSTPQGKKSTMAGGRLRVLALGLLLGAVAAPAPARAQDAPTSSRWLAFVGCWEPLGAEGEAGLLCFRPSGDGVEMSNVFEGEITATEFLVADGAPRAVSAEGCTGTESVEFSEDGRRVFTASSFTCEGGEERAGTGVMSFIAPTQWIDVRSLTIEGEPVAWVQRYSAATSESLRDHGVEDPMSIDRPNIRARRLLVARDIELDDVEEALDRVGPEAAKAWIATHETELDIDGETLTRLADSGVPDDVIDVIVAVSFPERFVLTPEGVPQGVVDRVAQNAYRRGTRFGYRSFLYDPFYYDPFYAPFGYRSYSRFGYYGYGFGGYYGYLPGSVIVIDRDATPYSGGRVIRGQGYRGPGDGGSTAGPRSSPPPSGSSSGGGGVSRSPSGDRDTSSGRSSGSSSSGRRAQRR